MCGHFTIVCQSVDSLVIKLQVVSHIDRANGRNSKSRRTAQTHARRYVWKQADFGRVLFKPQLDQHAIQRTGKSLGVCTQWNLILPRLDNQPMIIRSGGRRRFDGQRQRNSEGRLSIDHGMFTQQDHLATSGGTIAFGGGGCGEAPDDFFGLPDLDFAAVDQCIHHLVKQGCWNSGGAGNTSGMQPHVIVGDAACAQRAKCGEILCQTYHAHHACEFCGAG